MTTLLACLVAAVLTGLVVYGLQVRLELSEYQRHRED